MQPRRAFRPDLQCCILEDRLSPAVSNLGVIVLTTGGYYLLIPFPGPFAPPSTISTSTLPSSASGVNGALINTPFFMMGSGGISSVQPGNITGFPASAPTALAGSGRATAIVIMVGSGADDAGGPTIRPVTRNTIANDLLNPAPLIGGRPSGDTSPVLPAGQSYRTTTAPATTPPTGQATVASPPTTPAASSPPPYPPSVVPLVFPFKPATSSTTNPPGSAAGNPPLIPLPPPGSGSAGPGGGNPR